MLQTSLRDPWKNSRRTHGTNFTRSLDLAVTNSRCAWTSSTTPVTVELTSNDGAKLRFLSTLRVWWCGCFLNVGLPLIKFCKVYITAYCKLTAISIRYTVNRFICCQLTQQVWICDFSGLLRIFRGSFTMLFLRVWLKSPTTPQTVISSPCQLNKQLKQSGEFITIKWMFTHVWSYFEWSLKL